MKKSKKQVSKEFRRYIQRNLKRPWSEKKIIRIIRKLHHAYDVYLSEKSIRSTRWGDRLWGAACRRFGKWRDAVNAAGLNYDELVKDRAVMRWSKENVIWHLREYSKLGVSLYHTDLINTDWGSRLYYAGKLYFGSWKNAVEAAGLDYRKKPPVAPESRWKSIVITYAGWNLWHAKLEKGKNTNVRKVFHAVINNARSTSEICEKTGLRKSQVASVFTQYPTCLAPQKEYNEKKDFAGEKVGGEIRELVTICLGITLELILFFQTRGKPIKDDALAEKTLKQVRDEYRALYEHELLDDFKVNACIKFVLNYLDRSKELSPDK